MQPVHCSSKRGRHMKEAAGRELEQLCESFPALAAVRQEIKEAFYLLKECADRGGVIYTCGNGGSAADSEHIVGELMKGFKRSRALSELEKAAYQARFGGEGLKIADSLQHAIRAVSLVSQVSVATAFINDVGAPNVYAQQVYGYGRPGDLLWALSTSGNSKNILNAAKTAKVKEMKIIGMTGAGGGQLGQLADVCIHAPSDDTARVQEYHLPIYHCLCAMLEAEYFE